MARNVEVKSIKIVVLGDGSTGKTSIVSRYCQDTFASAYNQTIGLDFFLKRIDLPDKQRITLQIWDIGGQSLGGKMITTYLENAQARISYSLAIIFVYDVTNRESFENIKDWQHLVNKAFEHKKKPRCVLVANKVDLEHDRVVPASMHVKRCSDASWKSFQVSAKNSTAIGLMFREIVADITGIGLSKEEEEELKLATVKTSIPVKSKQEDVTSTKLLKEGDVMPTRRPIRTTSSSSSFCAIQ
eukprot:gene8574-10277_t